MTLYSTATAWFAQAIPWTPDATVVLAAALGFVVNVIVVGGAVWRWGAATQKLQSSVSEGAKEMKDTRASVDALTREIHDLRTLLGEHRIDTGRLSERVDGIDRRVIRLEDRG